MIKISELTSFCQDLVEAVSKLLGGRTINIMDLEGIIIASTEKNRIGTLHTGARHVVMSGHDLAITEELLPNYPGTKVGYNMPLTFHGRMIGVIGMYGIPEQVRDMAQLLKIYADKYFELEGNMEAKLVDLSLRSKLSGLLIAENASINTIENVMEMLDVSFSFPVRIIRISKDEKGGQSSLEDILSYLLSSGMIDPKKDFWSLEAGFLSLICSSEIDIRQLEGKKELAGCRMIMPMPAADYASIGKASSDALWIEKHMDARIVDLTQPRMRLEYMMYSTEYANRDIAASFISEMRRSLTENELDKCMEAVMCYYGNGMSVAKASAELGIHKNTLQGRVRKAMEAAGIQDYLLAEKLYLMGLINIHLSGKLKTTSSLDKLG